MSSEGTTPPGPEDQDQGRSRSRDSSASQPVWTFRGYKLRSSEFTTAMVHFFRAEVQRANVWRQRLDATTNWAVITTGAVISFAFSESSATHLVILLNIVLVTMFLAIEARRYRYYELWSYRVRLMETDFFAAMLVPPFHPSPDWAEALAENLLHPHYPISVLEALGRRLRRNYLWIYGVIALAWVTKVWLQPTPATTFAEFLQHAQVGTLSGEFVLFTGVLFIIGLIALSLLTLGLQQSAGEVLPRYGGLADGIFVAAASRGPNIRAWFRPTRHRQQLLTYIITDHGKEVTERILKDMHRGVTALSGTGMYTGEAHSVLMCALTVTEVPQLKALVNSVDPKSFVIVTPAQEVFGGGFMPLHEE